MNILLDTHAYLWFVAGDERLSKAARAAIENQDNLKIVSTASLWEITIKHGIGKLELRSGLRPVLTDYIASNGFDLLSIETGHLLELSKMDMHHRDPFDRLLIAQAKADNLIICSVDRVFADYGIEMIW
jgi:PIN domain nuclease of toxin-antitoxin system